MSVEVERAAFLGHGVGPAFDLHRHLRGFISSSMYPGGRRTFSPVRSYTISTCWPTSKRSHKRDHAILPLGRTCNLSSLHIRDISHPFDLFLRDSHVGEFVRHKAEERLDGGKQLRRDVGRGGSFLDSLAGNVEQLRIDLPRSSAHAQSIPRFA